MKTLLALFLSMATAVTLAAVAPDAAVREVIPGAHLMTSAEREQYRQRMSTAPTAAERERIRTEHTDTMDERARSFGLSVRRDAPAAAAAPARRAVKGDVLRGAALHGVCFSCHGPERYTAAKEQTVGFLASTVVLASGIEYATSAQDSARGPQSLPAGYPRMGCSQVKNVAGLKRAVLRWNDYFTPG
jgi:mono/diheme cytochrome c family protein